MGNFTGMPLSDEGRAKALLYTSNQPSTHERQCLPQSAGVFQYRPVGFRIWSELAADGSVLAWVMGGDNLRNDIRIWMDGRPHPSRNALHLAGGFGTGKWEGDTLTVRLTHLKTAWIRRGVGIPASDHTTITMHITPVGKTCYDPRRYRGSVLPEGPHVSPSVAVESARPAPTALCNTANEIPRWRTLASSALLARTESGRGLHGTDFSPAQRAAMGYAETLYPDTARRQGRYVPPPRVWALAPPGYCCGWNRTGGPGAARRSP